MSRRLITAAQAEEWRYDLPGDGRTYRYEPITGLFAPRARMTVLEEDGAGGWQPVIGDTYSATAIEEFGDYLRRLADYLKGTK